jgi:hypothetical protein
MIEWVGSPEIAGRSTRKRCAPKEQRDRRPDFADTTKPGKSMGDFNENDYGTDGNHVLT